MTREQLEEKKITKLNSLDEALEMIQLLNYDECIAALNGVKGMPAVMHKALMDRAKSLKGSTFELITASMQALVNR